MFVGEVKEVEMKKRQQEVGWGQILKSLICHVKEL